MSECESGVPHDTRFTFNDSHLEIAQSVQGRRARCVTKTSLLFIILALALMGASLTMVWCKLYLKAGVQINFYLWNKEVQSKRMSYGGDSEGVHAVLGVVFFAMFMCIISALIFLVRIRRRPTVECTKHFEDQFGNIDMSSTNCCSWHSAGWRLSWSGLLYGYYLSVFLLLAALSVFVVALVWVHVSIKLADGYLLSSLSYTQAGFILFCISGGILALMVSMESGFQTLLFQQAPYLRVIEATARIEQEKKNSQSGLRYRYGRDGSTIYGTMPEDFLRTYPQQPSVISEANPGRYSKFH